MTNFLLLLILGINVPAMNMAIEKDDEAHHVDSEAILENVWANFINSKNKAQNTVPQTWIVMKNFHGNE